MLPLSFPDSEEIWNNYQRFGLLFFNGVVWPLTFFLYYSIRNFCGISQGFFQWRGTQTDSEEVYLLLFVSPNNRQTMLAAKIAALASHYFLLNFLALTLPFLLLFSIFGTLSFWALLSFVLLHGFVFSLVHFLSVVPFLFYLFSRYSFKNQILAVLGIVLSLIITNLIFQLLPIFTPLVFVTSVLAGIYFDWFYWKSFSTKDFG